MNRERPLNLWRRTLGETLRRKGPDLSVRQMAILLTVYLTPPPHTVRGLAAEFRIAKPAVSRALDALGKFGFAKRRRDPADKRSVLVAVSAKGAVYLRGFAATIERAARDKA
jgi:DNA-binding MarR family transcriptional regulator